MVAPVKVEHRRILIVDDNASIHDDFKKTFAVTDEASDYLDSMERMMQGSSSSASERVQFDLEFAIQGQEAKDKVIASVDCKCPFALVFVDCRMPPGWDGVETIEAIWAVDPSIQVVFCTAFSDYSLPELRKRLKCSDRLLILKNHSKHVK